MKNKNTVHSLLLNFLPPNLSHKAADFLLSFYSKVVEHKSPPEWRPLHWKDLYFPNPLAPAGGVDKSAKHIKAWWALGAGFIEVGTITPFPQKKNPGPTIKRNYKKQALWNHLGFPGDGMEKAKKRLKNLQHFRPTPIFANIGKNRHTKNKNAETDYIKCLSCLHSYVDGFVINISSPNTKKLGELSQPHRLKKLLQAFKEKIDSFEKIKPFFIKWSPDLSEEDFLQSLKIALECGAEGHIICNTSIQRRINNTFPEYGGISGAPLNAISKERLKLTRKYLGTEKKNQLLVSVGGVLSPKDVLERLNLGADLVQTYSALVFQGPFFLQKVFQYQSKAAKPDKEKSKKIFAKTEKLINNHD